MHPLTNTEFARSVQAEREASFGRATEPLAPRPGVPSLARRLACWPGRLTRRALPFGVRR